MADDRYSRDFAVEKISGYMGMAHPTVSHADNFETAKAECISALLRGVEAVRSMSYSEYVSHRKADRAAAAIDAQRRET